MKALCRRYAGAMKTLSTTPTNNKNNKNHISVGNLLELAAVVHGGREVVGQGGSDRSIVEEVEVQHRHKRRVPRVPVLEKERKRKKKEKKIADGGHTNNV
jgi:hypothetical protein